MDPSSTPTTRQVVSIALAVVGTAFLILAGWLYALGSRDELKAMTRAECVTLWSDIAQGWRAVFPDMTNAYLSARADVTIQRNFPECSDAVKAHRSIEVKASDL